MLELTLWSTSWVYKWLLVKVVGLKYMKISSLVWNPSGLGVKIDTQNLVILPSYWLIENDLVLIGGYFHKQKTSRREDSKCHTVRWFPLFIGDVILAWRKTRAFQNHNAVLIWKGSHFSPSQNNMAAFIILLLITWGELLVVLSENITDFKIGEWKYAKK